MHPHFGYNGHTNPVPEAISNPTVPPANRGRLGWLVFWLAFLGVTGGMAGLRYGLSSIPTEWINALARHDEVLALADRFADACIEHWGTHEAV